MFVFAGRFAHLRVRGWPSWFIGRVVVINLIAAAAWAQAPQPLTMGDAERLALSAEPGRAALIAQATALTERSISAGQLPDPTLQFGFANLPLESGGFSTEGMTNARLALKQAFPPGRVRALKTRRLQALAAERLEHADERAREVRKLVRQAWLDTYYWQETAKVVRTSRPLFEDLAAIARSLYEIGHGEQLDVVRAELELSRLDDRLIGIDTELAESRALLAEWIGDDAERPIAAPPATWTEVPDLTLLAQRLSSYPALKAADARILARVDGVELAEAQYRPGFALDLGYAYRDGRLPDGRSRSDFLSLMVTVELPLFHRNRQDREHAAARSEQRAASASRERLERQLTRLLETEFARWHMLGRQIDLYDRVILSQANEGARAALNSYQNRAADFAEVMRGHIDEIDTQLAYLNLNVKRARSYAVLAQLGGLGQ